MTKSITIRDVARAAGVSRQTVSRAFNNKSEISPETKQHVLEVARSMGYRPSGLARSLSTNRTYTIGLLIPDNSIHFFALITKGAEDAAVAAGYSLFLVNTLRDIQRETIGLDTLWDRRVDGAILYASFLSPQQLSAYVDRFQHVVFINCQTIPTTSGKTASINVDDRAGARLAVSHFIQSGRSRIAFLAGPLMSISGQRRLTGYEQGFLDHDQTMDADLIHQVTPTLHTGYEDTMTLLKNHPDVNAILAYNDDIAVSAMNACADSGRRVPDDVAIIGFDDIPIAAVIRPSLTTVRIGKQDLGKLAMNTLIGLIEGENNQNNIEIKISPKLVIRDSAPEIS